MTWCAWCAWHAFSLPADGVKGLRSPKRSSHQCTPGTRVQHGQQRAKDKKVSFFYFKHYYWYIVSSGSNLTVAFFSSVISGSNFTVTQLAVDSRET